MGLIIRRRKPVESASTENPKEFSVTLEIPPSTNKLYIKRRGGGLALSAEAKRYRESVKKIISGHLHELMAFPVDPETVFKLEVVFYFETLENPGWFRTWEKDTHYVKGPKRGELKGKAGERKAKTRYKKIDYDNRIKFLQDCLVAYIGIPDDCQIFRGAQEKREDKENPRAECSIKVLSRDEFFLKGDDSG